MSTEDILREKIKGSEENIIWFESNIQKKVIELTEMMSKKNAEVKLKAGYERDLELIIHSRSMEAPKN